MQAKLPVLAVTDVNTDIGKVIVNGGFGWWCESNSVEGFEKIVDTICFENFISMGEKGFKYLKNNYSVEGAFKIITKE